MSTFQEFPPKLLWVTKIFTSKNMSACLSQKNASYATHILNTHMIGACNRFQAIIMLPNRNNTRIQQYVPWILILAKRELGRQKARVRKRNKRIHCSLVATFRPRLHPAEKKKPPALEKCVDCQENGVSHNNEFSRVEKRNLGPWLSLLGMWRVVALKVESHYR